MTWHNVAACFFGGAFLANFIPHFVVGISGLEFPSPFATPPFRGLSSPAVNVLWGLFNLVVAYALVVLVGNFELKSVAQAGALAAGFGLAAVGIARSAARVRAQLQ
jgi:hypothetical protein